MKKLIKFLLIFSVAIASAQKNIDPTDEDITLAKKLREQYGKDDVAILESSEQITFGVESSGAKVNVNNKIREKLMNITHRADINKYEFYDSESKIEYFTMLYRNNKEASFPIEDEFYKDDDYFYNDARVKHMSVDFPVQGYIYNYAMDKKYDDVKYFTTLYFNDEFPILQKTISVTVPKWLKIELKEFNFAGNDIVKTSTPDSDGGTTYTFVLKNVPPLYKEENTPGKSYIYPHLLLIAKSFTDHGKDTQLFTSAADMYKWYRSLVGMIKDDPSVLKPKVDELTANAKTDEEKIRNIYYWVQDNIRYIAFEDGIAGFKPDEADHVFQKRFGDCKGMANLIKQMLIVAGFDARLTWIGTKYISYDYSTPSLAVDNHMICTLFFKGKKYYLDGTEKFNALDINAERIQNKEVMIEDGDNFIIDKVPVATNAQNKQTFNARYSIENESIKGKCSQTYMGESCSEFLNGYNNFERGKKKEVLESYLSHSDKNIEVSNVVTSDLSNREQQLKVDYDVDVKNKVSGFDNEMYIDLDTSKEFKNFDLKDRKTDYEFDYKSDLESTVVLEIPAGYTVSKLPDNLNVSTADYTISIGFTQTPKEITCKKVFIFGNAVIKSSEIKSWGDLMKNLNTIYNQQIVLTKS
jgi:hypothetical protein